MIKANKVQVPGWSYIGDINLECGGMFYKYDDGFDYCEAVRIVPASDMGGPDNLFRIETGTIYFDPEIFNLAVLSDLIGPPELRQVVSGFESYSGMDLAIFSGVTNLAIGKPEKIWERGGEYNPTPDIQTHGNAKLHCAILQFLK